MIYTKASENLKVEAIYEFLKCVDELFPVPISSKTDLHKYAEKMHNNATICTYEEEGRILAMVAGYTDNTVNGFAYISMVVAFEEIQGRGIASQLVIEFIDVAREKGIKAIELYAVRENLPAIKMYQKLGFVEMYSESDIRPEDVHLAYYIKSKTALVTAIGSYSADIVIKNLKKIGYKVIGTDIYDKRWIANSLDVDAFYQVPKVINKNSYIKAIDNICMDEGVTHIIPSTDVEVDFFNEYRTQFEDKKIVVCIPPTETINICRNKKKQQEFIDSNLTCITTIPTLKVKDDMDMPFALPMVCKPYDGRSSQGLQYIYTKRDWKNILNDSKKDKYIVQPMIDGTIVTVDVTRQKDGKAVIAVPRKELLRTLNGAGTSVEVFHNEELEKICTELANALNIIGCVNFEFILDNEGKFHFVECNPRFSGGVKFTCMVGYDCIANHIKCFEGNQIDEFKFSDDIYIARKFEEYVMSRNQ